MSLRDYMRKTGFSRAVLGLSGGIDSALALAIAVDALGPDRVSAFNLPSRYNSETTRSIAAAADLGARRALHASCRSRRSTTGCARCSSSMPIPSRRASRARTSTRASAGVLMMVESNDTGALLISCGNETEIALGYATLYGDMCGGMSLIGDLSKTDVYSLARYVNRKHGARDRFPKTPSRSSRRRSSPPDQFDPFDYAVVVADRRRAGRAPHQPGRARARCSNGARSTRRGSSRTTEGRTPYDKYTAETFRAIVARRLAPDAALRLQAPARARRSSSSASAPSASTCAKRSSTAGKASGDGNSTPEAQSTQRRTEKTTSHGATENTDHSELHH